MAALYRASSWRRFSNAFIQVSLSPCSRVALRSLPFVSCQRKVAVTHCSDQIGFILIDRFGQCFDRFPEVFVRLPRPAVCRSASCFLNRSATLSAAFGRNCRILALDIDLDDVCPFHRLDRQTGARIPAYVLARASSSGVRTGLASSLSPGTSSTTGSELLLAEMRLIT